MSLTSVILVSCICGWLPERSSGDGEAASSTVQWGCTSANGVADKRAARPELHGRDDAASLACAVGRVAPSVILVKCPGRGAGTAFIISRKNRLLATAAHVADMTSEGGTILLAVRNGAAREYTVEGVWYHPALVRDLGEGLYAQSEDPADGDVAASSIDVAVIRIAQSGPDFPPECQLATQHELQKLNGRPVGLLAYVSAGEAVITAQPRLALGRITRVMDFSGPPMSAPATKGQEVWHSANLDLGSSGGPLFVENGHIIGVQSQGGWTDDGLISGACTTECLRELLAYHKMAALVPDIGATTLSIPDWKANACLPTRRLAARLIRRADELRRGGRFFEASLECNRAAGLVPDSPGVYLQRSKVYLYYCGVNWRTLNPSERERLAIWAFEDSKKCIELDPLRREAFLLNAQAGVYWVYADPHEEWLERLLNAIDGLLNDAPFDQQERAWMLNCRAQIEMRLGRAHEAESDYRESLRLDPKRPRWYRNRAEFWDWCRRPDMAAQDRTMASALER